MVFGGFRYTVCQQHRRYRGQWRQTRLQRLAPGSVILFGSHLDGDFVLDTVFVVKSSQPHDQSNYRQLEVPRTYSDVTLATLYDSAADVACCKAPEPGDQYTLYQGATPDDAVMGMYSFVPCRSAANQSTGFARPRVRHQRLSSTQAQGYGVPIEADPEAITELWNEVRRQVLGEGLSLATSVDFPPKR